MTDIAIRVQNLSKCYHIYDTPRDRLKQFVVPKLSRAIPALRKLFPTSHLPLVTHQGQPTPHSQIPTFYKEFWALKDVSFEIKKGETVGIIGRNGSGKSTLLQMICGTLTPTSGSIETNGRIAALLELGSGFNPEFTGRENVYMNASVLGLSKEEIDARFDDIVAFADIGDFIEQPVKTYSSGMFVRLAFAIQANVDPEILIVDEALAVGDAYFVHRCMHRFNQMQSEGKTILLVTHDATIVRQLCDRAIWVDKGAVVAMGEVSNVVDEYLAHLFSENRDAYVAPATFPEIIQGVVSNAVDAKDEHLCKHEQTIPNVDQRFGSRLCEVVGIGVYDKLGNTISATRNDTDLVLRISIKNNHPKKSLRMGVGYTFRSSNGVDISSSNTIVTGTDFGYSLPGELITVSMVITLPILHPGHYSFIPSTGYINDDGKPVETDRVINAVVIEVSSDSPVYVGMRFHTTFNLEARSIHEISWGQLDGKR